MQSGLILGFNHCLCHDQHLAGPDRSNFTVDFGHRGGVVDLIYSANELWRKGTLEWEQVAKVILLQGARVIACGRDDVGNT